MKKTIILTQFGSPHAWTQDFFNNVSILGDYGWYWKIFTQNVYEKTPNNVEIVPMSTEEFNNLTAAKLGVRPNMFMTPKGVPSVHVTDFYIFSGLIFEDYLRDSDYWGIANIDMVFGRIDRYLPDDYLKNFDVWTDDVNIINGIFTLFRNDFEVNRLCLQIPHWKEVITQPACAKCLGLNVRGHTLYGSDEYDLTKVMREPKILEKIRYGYPKPYPIHSHDRLEQHLPEPKLRMLPDGSLFELFEDIGHPDWEHAHPLMGKEIPYFHFLRSKKWPNIIRQ